MELSVNQDRALSQVLAWLKLDDNQVFRLFGYAGTGKTTIANHFAEGVKGQVLFAAFTGKAAHVMQQKGCEGASTIHSLIYTANHKSETRLDEIREKLISARLGKAEAERIADIERDMREEEQNLRRPSFSLDYESKLKDAALLIVDECSMVGPDIAKDLLSFGTKILVLGDPAQLPPVARTGGYFTDVEPDHMLTEVHRHALESPVYRIATDVRNGTPIYYGEYDGSYIRKMSSILDEDMLGTDQIIVGRNLTRRRINMDMRRLLDREDDDYPVKGDRLVCLRNNRDKGLLNGSIWNVAEDPEDIDEEEGHMDLVVAQNGEAPIEVSAHLAPFLGQDIVGSWNQRKIAEEFDYGFALTCHKSQGSQWNDILVIDESKAFYRQGAGVERRWLYTAVTRAAEKVRIYR